MCIRDRVIGVDLDLGPIHRQLQVVGPDPVAVGVGVGEEPAQQHLVGAGADPGHHVGGLEGGLLDLGEVVVGVAVQHHPADLAQRVVGMGPDLGHVEGVEAVVGGLLKGHQLHQERPGGLVAALDGLVQVAEVAVGVLGGHRLALGGGVELDALVGVEVVLDPVLLTARVLPEIGVAGVTVHVPPALGDAAVAHEDGHLMGRLRRQGPEVPLHVVVAGVAVGAPLLRMDEILEFLGISDEEHGGVVAHHVVVALLGVEPVSYTHLLRKTATP